MDFYILFLYFFIYSILGWIAEVIYCRLCSGKFTNRGFLNGPYCPIYGFGALLIVLFLDNFKENPVTVFFLGMFLTSILEYITSFLMEKIFNTKWWDYSNYKFNINGRVCLLNSTEFAILGLMLTYFIHPKITVMIDKIPVNYIHIITEFSLMLMIIDFVITLYTILNLNSKLKQIKLITDEIIRNNAKGIQNMDVIKSLENVKNNIMLKTTIFHNRIIAAFPEIESKNNNMQLLEIKENLSQKIKRKKEAKKAKIQSK